MTRITEGISGVLSSANGKPMLSWNEGRQSRHAYSEARSTAPSLRVREAGDIAVVFDLSAGSPIHIRPENEPWRVLAGVLGGTPAVIAETLWELLRRGFYPDEIVIFTTIEGEKRLAYETMRILFN